MDLTIRMSNNIVSEELSKLILKVIYVYVVPPFIVAGLIGNSMTLYLLIKEKKKTSTTYLLVALTCADLLFLLNAVVRVGFIIASHINPKPIPQIRIRYTLPLITFFYPLFAYISNWLIVMISLERAVAVLLPLKAKLFLTKRKSIVAIIVAFLIPIAATSTRLLQQRPIAVVHKITKEVRYKVDIYYLEGFDRDYFNTLRLVNTYLLYVVPVCSVICLNICIVIALLCNRRKFAGQLTNERQRKEARVTRMMVYLFACNSVSALSRLPRWKRTT